MIRPSHWSSIVQKQVIETPFTLLQDTVPSTWFVILRLNCDKIGATVAQRVELVDQWLEGRWFKSWLPWGRTELHVKVSLGKILKIAPDVQLAPCAAAISKGPAVNWQLIQGVPWPSPIEFTGFGPSNPTTPSKRGTNAVTLYPSQKKRKKTKR